MIAQPRIVIVGGGAAGFFAAITAAEAAPHAQVTILERGPEFLAKVRISGGGRCNVTHACFEPRALAARYPRGSNALMGPFHSFQPRDTIAWFEDRGVSLKTEADGRIFPTTDSSETIVECLLQAAREAGVSLMTNQTVERVQTTPANGFRLELTNRDAVFCERLMLATGGCRAAAAGQLAVSLGHTLEEPVPSLFTFEVQKPWIRDLAGVAVESAEVSVPDLHLRERGAVLLTHWGLSGPAVLRLSAWGARELHQAGYQAELHLNWLPHLNAEQLAAQLQAQRKSQPARRIVNCPLAPLTARLWERLVLESGIGAETRWADLSRPAQHALIQQLTRTQLTISGKSLNRDEFVTCGGVRLGEVQFKTMESRVCPGLHFGGELLDIDGLTGGFNFQAAWTTGWLAGNAMANWANKNGAAGQPATGS
jgi:predicted Rossmann fold flavoprotein